MPGCVFDKCRNHSKKNNKHNGVTFHAFPTDEIRKQKWIAVVRNQRREFDWMPTEFSRVCCKHFNPDHVYTTAKGLRRISNNAIPFFEDAVKADSSKTNEAPSTSDTEMTQSTSKGKNIAEEGSLSELKLKRKIKYLKEIAKRRRLRCNALYYEVKRLNKKVTSLTQLLKQQNELEIGFRPERRCSKT